MKILFCSLISLIIIILFSNCNSGHSKNQSLQDSLKVESRSIELSNTASKLIKQALITNSKSEKEVFYLSALDSLNKAIQYDSNNTIAYINKIDILIILEQREEAIKNIDVFAANNKNNAEVIATKGFILERLDQHAMAIQEYKKAIEIYEQRPKKDKRALVNDKCGEYFLLLFVENENKAIEELKKLKKFYPEYGNIIYDYETIILAFDKTKFLSEY